MHQVVTQRARWIGIATQAANDHPDFPYKDSESSRWKADAKERSRVAATKGIKQIRRRARNITTEARGDNGHHLFLAVRWTVEDLAA